MLTSILALLSGVFSTINSVTTAIATEREASLNATTDQDKIASEERIKTLEAQRDVLIADSTHSNIDLIMRTILAAGPAFILSKIFMYDKVFDGTTTLSPDLWNVIMVTIGFYFLHNTIVGTAKEFMKQ